VYYYWVHLHSFKTRDRRIMWNVSSLVSRLTKLQVGLDPGPFGVAFSRTSEERCQTEDLFPIPIHHPTHKPIYFCFYR
jgi:hypothetical protein